MENEDMRTISEDCELVKNPLGIYVDRKGNIYDKFKNKIEPGTTPSGYQYIDSMYLEGKSDVLFVKADRDVASGNGPVLGKYVHKIVVYSFGDCKGRSYSSTGIRNIIDHIDMNHKNNSRDNLQLVSEGINLFRAYYKTNSANCKERFFSYYKSLSDIERKILDKEIELDLEGKY